MNKQTKQKAIRQGDVLFLMTPKLPEGLKASEETTLLKNGSGGHSHTFKNGVFYPKVEGDFIIGYLEAKNTTIHHAEHSPKGDKIPDGVYCVRRQVEYTHSGMVQVQD